MEKEITNDAPLQLGREAEGGKSDFFGCIREEALHILIILGHVQGHRALHFVFMSIFYVYASTYIFVYLYLTQSIYLLIQLSN